MWLWIAPALAEPARPRVEAVVRVPADVAGLEAGGEDERARGPDDLVVTSDGTAVACAGADLLVVPRAGDPHRVPLPACDGLGSDGARVIALVRKPAESAHASLIVVDPASGAAVQTVRLPDPPLAGTTLVVEADRLEIIGANGRRTTLAERASDRWIPSAAAATRSAGDLGPDGTHRFDDHVTGSFPGATAVGVVPEAPAWHEVLDVGQEPGSGAIAVRRRMEGAGAAWTVPDPPADRLYAPHRDLAPGPDGVWVLLVPRAKCAPDGAACVELTWLVPS